MKCIAHSLILGVACAGTWDVLDNNFDTIILAVAFADTKNGIVPYDDNGSGPGVKVTTDGGQTWSHGTPTQYSTLLMDAAYVGKNAVIGGVFDTQWSADGGNTFNVSKGDLLVGQNCETIRGLTDDQFFGITGGDIRNRNGVAISTDAGKTVTFYNISEAQTIARYGAFPSRKVWYISAGQFPQSENGDSSLVRELTRRVHYHVNPVTGRLSVKLQRTDTTQPLKPTPNVDWAGQILKTADGGATWTSQFWTTDFYFNGIDCEDENKCCAVGESDTGSAPGARIFCTTDGTKWMQVYFASGAEHSLLGIRSVPGSPGEWFAGGGDLPSQFNITGTFPHSTDGGQTWNVETLKKVYVTDLSIVDASHGWGSTIEEDEQSGLVIYK
jgi:hypothetical protein